ncbi:MAG: 16S rRNA (guanine(527)-N(7))-methyltransferase RsmG [Bryobacteraceae bacterium]|nr:16S rRNA (guanine(527)-N(7))-methyltransferase RsmG [Bryobacteraceae bacterium]
MSFFRELLATKVAPFLALSESQLLMLEQHWELLKRWNRRLNLTAITKEADAVTRHYAESLFVAVQLPAGQLKIADIGSGAGFPGVPVAVARPECRVTLVESSQKKAVFLREATRGLSNVEVLCARAEQLKSGYDWLVSRAVRPTDVLRCARRVGCGAALLVRTKDADHLSGGVCPTGAVAPLPWDPWSCVLLVPPVSRGT